MHDPDNSFELLPIVAPEIDSIFSELTNGHTVKICAGFWSRWRTYEEWAFRITPEPYFSIRIYCTENSLPKRLVWVEEFCENSDFSLHNFDAIWQWLNAVSSGRAFLDLDNMEELLEYIGDGILDRTTAGIDAVEFFQRLPEIVDPDAFDKIDDSIFNDHNDFEQRVDK